MSNNQHEESENEYDISSDENSDLDSLSDSESDEPSEDEAQILARLRSRKKKLVNEDIPIEKNISLIVDEEVEDNIHHSVVNNNNEVLHIDNTSSRFHSVADEDDLDVRENLDGNITAVGHVEEGDSFDMIHDESVGMHYDDEDQDTERPVVDYVGVLDRESEIKEEIEHECPALDNLLVHRTHEEVSDETEDMCSSEREAHSGNMNLDGVQEDVIPDIINDPKKSARGEDIVEEVSDRVIPPNDDFTASNNESDILISSETMNKESDDIQLDESGEVKDSDELSSPIAITKVDKAEENDTVTYEDPPRVDEDHPSPRKTTSFYEEKVDLSGSLPRGDDSDSKMQRMQKDDNVNIENETYSTGDQISKQEDVNHLTDTLNEGIKVHSINKKDDLMDDDVVMCQSRELEECDIAASQTPNPINHGDINGDALNTDADSDSQNDNTDITDNVPLDDFHDPLGDPPVERETEQVTDIIDNCDDDSYASCFEDDAMEQKLVQEEEKCESTVPRDDLKESNTDVVKHTQQLQKEDSIKESTLQNGRENEELLSKIAEVEELRRHLEASEQSNSEMMSKIVKLEHAVSNSTDQIESQRCEFLAEMDNIKKQHSADIKELSTRHKFEMEEVNKKIADYVQQAKEDEASIDELSMKLSAADSSYVELDTYVRNEPARQQEAIRSVLEKYSSDMKTEIQSSKDLRPSIETQTDPDAILVEAQRQLSAGAEANDSLQDDVDGLKYMMEEIQGELASMTKKYETTSAEYNNIMSTVINHEDKAKLLQFKLEAANKEADRSVKDYQDLYEQYNSSQNEVKKYTKMVNTLRTQYDEMENSKDYMASQLTASSQEVQLLKEKIKSLEKSNILLQENYDRRTPEKAILKSGNYSPELFPSVKVMRSTAAEEPDQLAQNIHTERTHHESLFPDVTESKPRRGINEGFVAKSTKKQEASEKYKKQQASASEPSLPALDQHFGREKKKKKKKMKSKVISQCDDNSVGSNQSIPKKSKLKIKKCAECGCRIKGEAKILSYEIRHHDSDEEDEDGGHDPARVGEATFCTWVCARTWSSKQGRRAK